MKLRKANMLLFCFLLTAGFGISGRIQDITRLQGYTSFFDGGAGCIVQIHPHDTTVCSSVPITLTAIIIGGAATYLWSTGSTSSSITVSPSSTSSYWVQASSRGLSCSDTAVITVLPALPVSVAITASDDSVCQGETVCFTATSVNGGSPPDYRWIINGILYTEWTPTFCYIPSNKDTVYCILNSSVACPANNPDTSGKIIITVSPILPVSVTITSEPSGIVCAGSAVICTAIPVNGGITPGYQWKLNGVNAGTNSPTYSFVPINNDHVTCTLTSGIPCPTGNPAVSNQLTYSVGPRPFVSFSACNAITTRGAQPFAIKGGIPQGGDYSGPGVIGNMFYPALVPLGQTIVPVTYRYTNASGCADSAVQTITDLPDPVFTCGQSFPDVRDTSTYPTRMIGSQCWMVRDLNFGNFILSSLTQNDNCIPEKYCYNDNTLKCDSLGGMYQWDEVMQYFTSPLIQGLCPPQWHIPDENEWTQLFNAFGDNAHAGDSLRFNGSSGFNAFMGGAYFLDRQFGFKSFAGFFWSSSSHGNNKAWAHALNTINHSVSWYPSFRSNAFSVRCVKD
jgi:uncharacterized protein (TIGR02145 family)